MTTHSKTSNTNIVTEIAADIYSLRLPMPMGLDHINVYLIKETNRIALVDCGLDLPDSWEALEKGFATLGLHPDQLTDIFVTHSHPDHIGQLHRLRKIAPHARLFMHRIEYDNMLQRNTKNEVAMRAMQGWLDRNGMVELTSSRLMRSGFEKVPDIRPGDTMLDGGERIKLEPTDASQEWEILWTPGHTAGHFVLFSQERGLLLSGDHLLTSISSNIGKYPGSTEDPLGDFISSLEAISRLEVNTVLPAHGIPFTNHRERISHLINHHHHRLGKIYATLECGPRTAAEVVQQIWGDRVEGFHRYLALIEALSHLERLHREGRVTTEEDGAVLRYRAA